MNPRPSPGRRPWHPPSLQEMQARLPLFEFVSLIGQGGMGVVYLAHQRSLHRQVAIKVLPADAADDTASSSADRFRLEARTLAKLSHPGIVSVFDSGETDGLLYIVMEYVDGTDVARMIQSAGRLPSAQAASLLTQVCDALEYAHRNGIVHRDLKPANLLVTREGRVKIADFGLAKYHNEPVHGLTQTNVAIGTPEFLAPEAWSPGIQLDPRADLYSAGVTLYQMLTGDVPRGLWKMPSTRVGTDPRFDAIVDRAMQPEREARYASAAELRQDLDRIRQEPGGAAPRHPVSRAGDPPPPSRRQRTRAGTLAITLPALLVLAWYGGMRRPGEATRVQNPPAATATPMPPPSPSALTAPTVREAARWLLRERAEFSVASEGRERAVATEADLPPGDFDIVRLGFDRWKSSPPEPPPPADAFRVMNAVTTLRQVYLRLPGITDGALAFLAGNPELRSLTISGSREVTDHVLAHLAGLQSLQSLCISHAPRVTGREFPNAAWLKTVRDVDFLNATLDDGAIRILSRCPHLKTARLEGTRMTVDGLMALASVPGLVELSAGYCEGLSEDDFVEVLPEFTHLRKLELVYAPIGNQGAKSIAALTNLVELHLSGTRIGDEGLAALSALPRLQTVALSGTRITTEGITSFQRVLPGCRVIR